jgi:hypothetical protein
MRELPQQIEFQYNGGSFVAKKSFWQNTLDKSHVLYEIELVGFGEYGECHLTVAGTEEERVAELQESVKKKAVELAQSKFLEDDEDDIVEAVASTGEYTPVDTRENVLDLEEIFEDDEAEVVREKTFTEVLDIGALNESKVIPFPPLHELGKPKD